MIYFVVTACLTGDPHREEMYKQGMQRLLELTKDLSQKYIIVVEGNGIRKTMLEELGADKVFYTTNNSIPTPNKGIKELLDIFEALDHVKAEDDDFIVKLTCRYIIHHESQFMRELYALRPETNAILKFGSFFYPTDDPCNDCITGLIGARCKVVRKVQLPSSESECVEHLWAKVIMSLPPASVIGIKGLLGLDMCAFTEYYYTV